MRVELRTSAGLVESAANPRELADDAVHGGQQQVEVRGAVRGVV